MELTSKGAFVTIGCKAHEVYGEGVSALCTGIVER